MSASILVVEDDVVLNHMLQRTLRQAGYEMAGAYTWAEARTKLDSHAPDLVLLDLNLPDSQDLGPLAELTADRPTVMLTAYGSIDHAVQAMRLGAADYLVKPVNLDELELVIRRALVGGRLRAAHAVGEARSSARRTPDLLGESPAMHEVRELIDAVADTPMTVLVTGDSGVGKELVASAVHKASGRHAEPFVAVDCTTLQETLFESELFGHERGAFTGADRRKPGLIEAAAGGTLFLDEIGDIGPALQAKLLRVLETGRFRRVGATADLRADVRVVAATNRDLPAAVKDGGFRADLYYRLSAFTIPVPPLRQRPEDVPLLVQHFIARASRRPQPHTVTPEAMQHLLAYDWPGNVRELRNVIERAVLLAHAGPQIEPRHLPVLAPPAASAADAAPMAAALAALWRSHEPTLDEIERLYLTLLLERHGGNRRQVAEAMGVSERTAYRMLERHGLRQP